MGQQLNDQFYAQVVVNQQKKKKKQNKKLFGYKFQLTINKNGVLLNISAVLV